MDYSYVLHELLVAQQRLHASHKKLGNALCGLRDAQAVRKAAFREEVTAHSAAP